MQVLLNKTASTNVGHELTSVGDFTTSLFEINAAQAYGGYPTNWTKYEYVVTGITDGTVIRIGFRRFVTNPGYARGIGIDLFRFAVK
jgi:hypothetical protein